MSNHTNTDSGNLLFPVFFRLDRLQMLVVGGGFVGTEKVGMMFRHASNANVHVVAPLISDEIKELAENHPDRIKLSYRKFENSDLDGIDLVIAATADHELNVSVHTEAKKRKIIVNVADTPSLCDFYLSSVVKKGDLKIAISSNGKSPTLTKRIREMLEDVLPDEIDEVLEHLQAIRDQLKGDFEEKVRKLDEITSVMRIDKEDKNKF